MGGLARWDILVPLLVIAFFFFGAKRLPELGSSVGKTIKEFQKSIKDVNESVKVDDPTISTPARAPELKAPVAATEAEAKPESAPSA